jgi:hypothetical protein
MDNKEKLEEAKRLYETANADQKYVLESLFPELMESEDEKLIKNLISTLSNLYARNLIEKETKEKYTNWLKSIRPQPKQEWSEEDERLRQSCIKHIEEELEEIRNDKYGHSEIISDLKESCRERIKWLESLRPQYKWKPSDEQIKAIQTAIGIVGELTPTSMLLKELKKQLKKL